MTLVVFVRDGFAAVQACNPPDTLFAIAAPYKLLGVRFVFDQHDLCPEIFDPRFGAERRTLRRLLLALERATYATADHVIATNDSLPRSPSAEVGATPTTWSSCGAVLPPASGRKRRDRSSARASLTCAAISGSWDPRMASTCSSAVDVIVHRLGRTDCRFAVLGFGDCEAELRQLSSDLGLDDWVVFTGRADDRMITEYLSTADLGSAPDPRNDFNNRSTMNKVLEYMAMGLPVVAFDLDETASRRPTPVSTQRRTTSRRSRGRSSGSSTIRPREDMGRHARQRIDLELGWEHQAPRYTGVYDELLTKPEA